MQVVRRRLYLNSWWWHGSYGLPGFGQLDAWRRRRQRCCVGWDGWRLCLVALCRAHMPTLLHTTSKEPISSRTMQFPVMIRNEGRDKA